MFGVFFIYQFVIYSTSKKGPLTVLLERDYMSAPGLAVNTLMEIEVLCSFGFWLINNHTH